MKDDTDSVNLVRAYFESDVEHKNRLNCILMMKKIVGVRFEHLFPRVKGHAKLINGFDSSRRSSHCISVKYNNIEFH